MFSYYLKLALNNIRQNTMLSGLILFAIALGIGVSMTMLSLYHAMAYNPANTKSNVLHAVQLAAYDNTFESWGEDDGLPTQVTHQDSLNLREADLPFKRTPMYAVGEIIESANKDYPLINDVLGRLVDSDFFSMFEIDFIHGNGWSNDVDANPEFHIVIDNTLNQTLFEGKNSIGESIFIAGNEFTVIGVFNDWHPLPSFHDLTGSAFPKHRTGYYIPFSVTNSLKRYPHGNISGWKTETIASFDDFLTSELVWQLFWVALPTEEDKAAYQAFLDNYVSEQQKIGRFTNKNSVHSNLRNVEAWLEYQQVIREDNRVMLGISFLFLAVCLINTVGLLLAKFLRKLPDAGVRRALGATRGHIFKQYMLEVGLLGLLGGGLGLIFSLFGLWGIRSLYPQYIKIAHLDFTMVITAIALSVLSALLAGLYPSIKVCFTQPSFFLKAQ